MVAELLRRMADEFIEMENIRHQITRAPRPKLEKAATRPLIDQLEQEHMTATGSFTPTQSIVANARDFATFAPDIVTAIRIGTMHRLMLLARFQHGF